MKAEPLAEEVSKAVEDGKIGPRDDIKIRARLLADEYGWDVTDARKIWCFVCFTHCIALIFCPQLAKSMGRVLTAEVPTSWSMSPRECSTSTKSRTLASPLSNGHRRKV